MRIAIVGSGIAGLASAWLLSRGHEVVLFEADDRLGGHTHTHDIDLHGRRYAVDTGFIVHNPAHYPLLNALFDELGVGSQPTTMSFSVRNEASGLEYNATTLATLFCQRRNLVSPRFWGMLRDLTRFYREAPALLDAPGPGPTLGEYLDAGGYGAAFRDDHLVPMASALWSSPASRILAFPAQYLMRFMANHQMLQVNDRPQWWTVAGGARAYVQAMLPAVHELRLRCPVQRVERVAGGVRLHSPRGAETFDAVVMAGHSDQSLALLAQPGDAEAQVLGAIRYHANTAVLHTDERLLPRRRLAWAAWNYERGDARSDPHAVCLHYLLNRLQPLPWQRPVIVSLNPVREPDPATVHGRYAYAHPVFDEGAVRAQARLPALQGQGGIWYAGAWTRYGFHEDGLLSGLTVAQHLAARVLA